MVAIREIAYEADGRQMVGTLGLPDGDGDRPAVLIAHEGPGLDEFQKNRARQLAELGYVAFALDYHGDGEFITDRQDMMDRLAELSADLDRLRAIGTAGLDVLLNEPRADSTKVAAIGYCFGGTVALELARMGSDLKAVVGFHPGLDTIRPDDAANIKGKVLICIGADDPMVDARQRRVFEDEMSRRRRLDDDCLRRDGTQLHASLRPPGGHSGHQVQRVVRYEGVESDAGSLRGNTGKSLIPPATSRTISPAAQARLPRVCADLSPATSRSGSSRKTEFTLGDSLGRISSACAWVTQGGAGVGLPTTCVLRGAVVVEAAMHRVAWSMPDAGAGLSRWALR